MTWKRPNLRHDTKCDLDLAERVGDMQRVKNARDQFNSQAQWVQLGLLTASTLTPLVRRWNELRAMDHRLAVREEAAPPHEAKNDDAEPHTTISPSSIVFWVVGVGVGIIA